LSAAQNRNDDHQQTEKLYSFHRPSFELIIDLAPDGCQPKGGVWCQKKGGGHSPPPDDREVYLFLVACPRLEPPDPIPPLDEP
jgi:hypothetical protein